jgi:hypothetical protein
MELLVQLLPTPTSTAVRCGALERRNKGDYKELSNSR